MEALSGGCTGPSPDSVDGAVQQRGRARTAGPVERGRSPRWPSRAMRNDFSAAANASELCWQQLRRGEALGAVLAASAATTAAAGGEAHGDREGEGDSEHRPERAQPPCAV